MATIQEFITKAQTIRGEVTMGANTAERVGDALETIGDVVKDFAKVLVLDLTLAELQAQTHTAAARTKVMQILPFITPVNNFIFFIKPYDSYVQVNVNSSRTNFSFILGEKLYVVTRTGTNPINVNFTFEEKDYFNDTKLPSNSVSFKPSYYYANEDIEEFVENNYLIVPTGYIKAGDSVVLQRYITNKYGYTQSDTTTSRWRKKYNGWVTPKGKVLTTYPFTPSLIFSKTEGDKDYYELVVNNKGLCEYESERTNGVSLIRKCRFAITRNGTRITDWFYFRVNEVSIPVGEGEDPLTQYRVCRI